MTAPLAFRASATNPGTFRRLQTVGVKPMFIVLGIVAAVLLLGLGIFFYLANGARSRTALPVEESARFRRGKIKERDRAEGLD